MRILLAMAFVITAQAALAQEGGEVVTCPDTITGSVPEGWVAVTPIPAGGKPLKAIAIEIVGGNRVNCFYQFADQLDKAEHQLQIEKKTTQHCSRESKTSARCE